MSHRAPSPARPTSAARKQRTPAPSTRSTSPSRSVGKGSCAAASTSATSPPSASTNALQQQAAAKALQTHALIEAVLESVRSGNDDEIVRLLEEDNVDVDSKDSEGRTPLIIASRDNRPATAKMLLSHKADVNIKTRLGATALIAAATHGHTAIVKLLLSANADRNIACNGMKPIDLARRQNKADVVALLLMEGQPTWGSGQPRSTPAGLTGITYRALQASKKGDMDEQDAFEVKQFRHREKLMKLKDGGAGAS